MVDIVSLGLLLVFAGFGLIFLATLLSSKKSQGAEVKGGGVIMIGPIPIIFGSDAKWTSIAIVLAIALILVSLLFTYLM